MRVPMCVSPINLFRSRCGCCATGSSVKFLIWIQFIALHCFTEIYHRAQFKCNSIEPQSIENVHRCCETCADSAQHSTDRPFWCRHEDLVLRSPSFWLLMQNNWSETAQQLTRISVVSDFFFFLLIAMASWSIPCSFIGWHKNELCRIILLSWLIHFIIVKLQQTRRMNLKEIPTRCSFNGLHQG